MACEVLFNSSLNNNIAPFAGMARASNGALAAALAVFVSGGLAFPYFITRKQRVSLRGPMNFLQNKAWCFESMELHCSILWSP